MWCGSFVPVCVGAPANAAATPRPFRCVPSWPLASLLAYLMPACFVHAGRAYGTSAATPRERFATLREDCWSRGGSRDPHRASLYLPLPANAAEYRRILPATASRGLPSRPAGRRRDSCQIAWCRHARGAAEYRRVSASAPLRRHLVWTAEAMLRRVVSRVRDTVPPLRSGGPGPGGPTAGSRGVASTRRRASGGLFPSGKWGDASPCST